MTVRDGPESAIWPVALRDLDLGPPRNRCNYIPRGGTRLCRASLWRRYRLAPWPRHLQSAKADRPNRDDFATGGAAFSPFSLLFLLCATCPPLTFWRLATR